MSRRNESRKCGGENGTEEGEESRGKQFVLFTPFYESLARIFFFFWWESRK